MAHPQKEIIDAFRAAAKFKTAGQIARESDIKLTTAKRLLGKGYPKGALKGEVVEAVVAFTKAESGQAVARESPGPSLREKAAAWDAVVAMVRAIEGDDDIRDVAAEPIDTD